MRLIIIILFLPLLSYGQIMNSVIGNARNGVPGSAPPIGDDVSISGDVKMASKLTAIYAVNSSKTVQWYRANDNVGTGEVAINGALYDNYKPCLLDVGKYLRVGVTLSPDPTEYSDYTAVVTRQVVFFDEFNYGTTINSSNWTVTNPSDNISIAQTQGGILFTGTTGTTIAGDVNKMESVTTLASGTMCFGAIQTNTSYDNTVFVAMQFGSSSNRIVVKRQSGSANATLIVTVAGSDSYSTNVSNTFTNNWKITYTLSGDIAFYVYEATTDSWNSVGTYNHTFSGSATALVSMGVNTAHAASCYFDNIYLTNENYTHLRPDMFIPTTSDDNVTGFYQGLQLGWFFHNHFNAQYCDPPYDCDQNTIADPRTEMIINYDWDTFADEAEAGDADYVIIQASREDGIRLWDDSAADPYNGGSSHSYNGSTVPQYGFDYTITNSLVAGEGVTDDFVQRGIDAFTAKGIPTGVYFHFGRDYNMRTATVAATSNTQAIYSKFDEYMSWVERDLVNLVTTHTDIRFIWLDHWNNWYPQKQSYGFISKYDNYQRLYQRIKEVNSSVIIIANFFGPQNSNSLYQSGSLYSWPVDVISCEYFWKVGDTDLENEASNYSGTSYYIPKEIVWSGLYMDTNTIQYAWVQQLQYPSSTVNQIYDQTTFQDRYDFAKARGTPFLINIPIKHDNTLDATYISRVNNITR